VSRRITELDEYPRHQTLDTFDVVASDSAQWSDGSWICVGDPEGTCHLITAIRVYPNTDVMDAYAIVSLDDGRQYNLRASRRLRPRSDELDCGPLWMEIVRGLRTLRFGARPNESGVEFDLTWEGASPVWDESPGVVKRENGRIVRARSNYMQVGHVAGSITVNGRRFEVGPDWVGARDHSWGLGDTGTANMPPVAAPAGPVAPGGAYSGAALRHFGLRHWSWVRLPDRTLIYHVHRGADGRVDPMRNRVDHAFDSGRDGWSYRSIDVVDAEFVDGQRRQASAVVHLTRSDGQVDRYRVTTRSRPTYMQGGGYWDGFDDRRGRGVYRGELVVEHDVWDVSHPTIVRDLEGRVLPQRNGAWAQTVAWFENLDDPSDCGPAELEAVIGGPYPGITQD
jgi:hypothetical protein